MEGLVVWSRAHRDALEQRYTLNRQAGTPSDLNIRLAQEDIWLLQNLAKVIRKTNEGAADVIAVPIKRIDSLDIAQWAVNDAVRESPKVFVDTSVEGGAAAVVDWPVVAAVSQNQCPRGRLPRRSKSKPTTRCSMAVT